MSNDFDDATQLGSIGHNPSVPSQPGQQQPAFHTPNLPEQPQADEDPEGTLLSAHGTTQPALPRQRRTSRGSVSRCRRTFANRPPIRQSQCPRSSPSSQPNPSNPASLYSPSNNPSRSSTRP